MVGEYTHLQPESLMRRDFKVSICLLIVACFAFTARADDAPQQTSVSGITHAFLALGAETYIVDAQGKIVWRYPHQTRDGFVLPNGNILLAVSKDRAFPGGAAVEVTRDGRTVFQFKGTQSEVNTVQAVEHDRIMLTEAGPHPRILEVDRVGKIVVEVPIQAQTKDLHLQTRMTRKLPNSNYLVPQLLDKVVREYAPDGKIVSEAKTPDTPAECWPFSAIRLPNGNTLINCTHGLMTIEVDPAGKIVWQLTNDDLPEPLLIDPCGCQRLGNGNTIIASYGSNKPGAVKLLEVTPQKKVVWTYRDSKTHGIHELQILDANGNLPEGRVMK